MLSKQSSRVRLTKSSSHCPVCLMQDRLKVSFPAYSSRANLLSKNSDSLFGAGHRYAAQK